jgi:acyl-CoA synthetase (AMP-forming)/AMP-acid ligase II
MRHPRSDAWDRFSVESRLKTSGAYGRAFELPGSEALRALTIDPSGVRMTIYGADTVPTILCGADAAPAIGAPGRPPMSHGVLRGLVERAITCLNGMGIGRGDRVAMVLPNGPEMAAAFVAVTCAAIAAPLNPAYCADEFDFYLRDLKAKCLIVQRGVASVARLAAAALGIAIVELLPCGGPGDFVLCPEAIPTANPAGSGAARGEDIALLLHTSGTTSRPKIVPLRHANITASACHIRDTLALTSDDCCLNIMPLFHIHGLIAAVLASLSAGASDSCTPGFQAFRFFSWFDEVRPSWFTAVPTMHQALLVYAERSKDIISRGRLRLVRSSSASLPSPVMAALEAVFGVPVIESYGMTEAAHQMSSNPLPPRPRYAGSVGIAAGPELAIIDDHGDILPPGALGEVVIRGANVTSGYENNPEANAAAFINDWFRTGDQGLLDDAGYLRLTGRLKEIINRGGEKISPLEIEAVLLKHPAIAQVVIFGLPHSKLGEEVAAAIVLRAGVTLDEHGLRDFARARLAGFKVPRKVVFLREIPLGSTGKLQRSGLAKSLGLMK